MTEDSALLCVRTLSSRLCQRESEGSCRGVVKDVIIEKKWCSQDFIVIWHVWEKRKLGEYISFKVYSGKAPEVI